MSVNIQLEWTPNPSTLKYVVDQRLLPSGAINFTDRQKAVETSPLAHKLMDISGVVAVMLGTNFVTVTKGESGEWDELNDAVMSTLDTHLTAGEAVVNEAALEASKPPAAGAAGSGSEVEQKIREILEAEIRPAVMMDGGDITLDRFEDGIVYLHMKGSCSGCPSSTMTLKMGIESRLKESIPEVNEVVSL
jgi:Fe-S cluster biogenesis protein NfuA